MKNVFFEHSLSNETIEVLGFRIIDALEKKLELLAKDLEDSVILPDYND